MAFVMDTQHKLATENNSEMPQPEVVMGHCAIPALNIDIVVYGDSETCEISFIHNTRLSCQF